MFLDEYDFSDFDERDKYVIVVDGTPVEVSKEVYFTYYKMERQEKYQEECQNKFLRSLNDTENDEEEVRGNVGGFASSSLMFSISAEDAYFKIQDNIVRDEMERRAISEIEKLSDSEKAILYGRLIEDKSYELIGTELGVGRNVIRRKEGYILARLRKKAFAKH